MLVLLGGIFVSLLANHSDPDGSILHDHKQNVCY